MTTSNTMTMRIPSSIVCKGREALLNESDDDDDDDDEMRRT